MANAWQIAKFIARRATLLGWFDAPTGDAITTCSAVKTDEGKYIYGPDEPCAELVAAIARLDEDAIICMASEVTDTALDALKPGQLSLVVESTGARIPIMESLAQVQQSLAFAASACIIKKERCVLIWSNEPKTVVNVAHNVEKQMLAYVSRIHEQLE